MHWLFWLILFIVFVAIELSTVQLVSIWFALGALAAGITSIITDNQNLTYELIAFAVVTALALLVTAPFVKKVTHVTPVATNADSLLGQTAVVTEPINNVNATGAVTIKGNVWTARLEETSDTDVPEGTEVTVVRIDGVKLIVKVK